jgi:hypothetical protein
MRLQRPDYWNVWWTLTMISATFTIVVLTLGALGVFHDVGLVVGRSQMTEHSFQSLMLAVVIFEAFAGNIALAYLVYRVYRISERNDRLVAATYLEARKALEQHR